MDDKLLQAINRFGVLMEDQNAKLDAVLELLGDAPKLQDFHRLEDKVDKLSEHMDIAESAVAATNHDIAEMGKRVTRLEAA